MGLADSDLDIELDFKCANKDVKYVYGLSVLVFTFSILTFKLKVLVVGLIYLVVIAVVIKRHC